MSIVVKSDVIMDECVFLAGASGMRTRQNDRTANQGGYETVNAVRDVTLSTYSFGAKPMDIDAWSEVEGVYEDTDAGTFGFLIKDPIHQSVTVADGGLQGYMLGVQYGVSGFGNGTPTYVLGQFFKPQSTTRRRFTPRTRPIGTPSVFRGGSPVTVGVAAGNIAFSAAPVFVTFVADTSQALTSITTGASTVLNFADGTGMVAATSIGQRVYVTGVSGTAATTLNSIAHVVTAKGATSLTVSTVTTGLSGTGGTAAKYPQADEALTAAFSFYVPVHFASDNLEFDIVLPGDVEDRIVAGPNVTLIEVREA